LNAKKLGFSIAHPFSFAGIKGPAFATRRRA